MLPAHQCFERLHVAGRQVDYRLIKSDELRIVDRASQTSFERQLFQRLCVHLSSIKLMIVATTGFCSIERGPGVLQNAGRPVLAVGRKRDADTRGQKNLLVGYGK